MASAAVAQPMDTTHNAAPTTGDEVAELPPSLKTLTDLLESRVEGFAAGDEEIRAAGLEAAKFIFDNALKTEATAYPAVESLLRSVSAVAEDVKAGTTKLAGQKRKRSPTPPPPLPSLEPTPLSELFTQGMDTPQIWEQLELRTSRVLGWSRQVLEFGEDEDEGVLASDMMDLMDGEEGEMDSDELDEMGSEEEDPSLTEDTTEEEDEEEDGEEGRDPEEGYGEEQIAELRDSSDDEDEEDDDEDPKSMQLDRALSAGKSGSKKRKHPTLDDDFFSIDEFNRETEAMEARSRGAGRLDDDDEEDADEDVDLFQEVEDDAGVEDEEPGYAEFFAPVRGVKPPSKGKGKQKAPAAEGDKGKGKEPAKGGVRFNEAVRVKTIKPKKKKMKLDFDPSEYPFMGGEIDEDGVELSDDDDESDEEGEGDVEMDGVDDFDEAFGQPGEDEEDQSEEDDEEDEEDDDEFEGGAETITRLKDDLFGDDDDEQSKSANLSTHEKRMAALNEQIKALEAENVAQKDWVLMGEAGARSRPVNSLLEEDLDFEHVAKQVPVVTEETTRTLEELIKRRILDNHFDDVVRKRPVDDKPFLPSRMFELQDTRSQRSLAQIYEDEYTAARAGDPSIVDDRDGKLKKEHEEIQKMWEDIAYKLDALSNAHFTPKAPKASIQTVSNLPSISMESAMPTTQSTATMLAPEEVFSTTKGALVSKTEMTPAEKKAQRRKHKAAFKHDQERLGAAVKSFSKAKNIIGDASGKKGKKGTKGEKEEALKRVVKEGRGVTVIGKDSKGKGKGKDKAIPKASLLKL